MKNINLILANIIVSFIFFVATTVMFGLVMHNQSVAIQRQNANIVSLQKSFDQQTRLLSAEARLNSKLNKISAAASTASKAAAKANTAAVAAANNAADAATLAAKPKVIPVIVKVPVKVPVRVPVLIREPAKIQQKVNQTSECPKTHALFSKSC